MKKIFTTILLLLCAVIVFAGCGDKTYSNDFDGFYSYIVENNVNAFYEDWGYYGGWRESKGYFSAGNNCITVSFYAFDYADESKETLKSSSSLYITYDGSRHADYRYFTTFHNIGTQQYSNGIFTVGDYTGYSSHTKLTPTETNMSTQPTSAVNLLTTLLRNYLHSKDFTLEALGYAKYK